jgi:hypothetical protein
MPVTLLVAFALGYLARRLLRRRVRLSGSTATVVAVLGMSGGLLFGALLFPDHRLWSPGVLLVALLLTVLLLICLAAAAARLQRPVSRTPVEELVRGGESDRLEFKSSARWNLHTRARDDKIEQVVAKTVAGFLNTDGGTLLIGVDDAGTVVGLAADFQVVKSPDPDRYELWLRDFLAQALGQNAAALPLIDFTAVKVDETPTYVCRVACPASPRPVYVRSLKGPATSELWVRTGNSTRQLRVDDAVDYVMHRWPLGFGSNLAAQLRAAVRGTGTTE